MELCLKANRRNQISAYFFLYTIGESFIWLFVELEEI